MTQPDVEREARAILAAEASDRLDVLLEAAEQVRAAAIDFHASLAEWQTKDPTACTGPDGQMALLRWLADEAQFKRIAAVEFIVGGESARASDLVSATGGNAIKSKIVASDEMIARGMRGHAQGALGCRCDVCPACGVRNASETMRQAEDALIGMFADLRKPQTSPLVGPGGKPIQKAPPAIIKPDGNPFRSN